MADLILQALSVAHIGPVDLQIKGGEIVCLSGTSGSGNSLLLRAIADIIPHSGQVLLGEEPSMKMSAPRWRKQVALLPAENQWWHDHIGEHFTYQDNTLLQAFGFDESVWQWQVARCSTGEKQRLALLRLLCNQPRCLLLDEPTASLDPENTTRVETVILEYVQKEQVPVLWVSHSPEQIKRVAQRHYRMHDSKLEQA